MNAYSESATESVEALLGQVADEFTERLKRGEQPDTEEYANRYPQIAGLLRQVLPALLVMGPGTVETGDDYPGDQLALGGCLGDFRILREVGRGGMGIVYESRQISLNRRVALKVLPFAATLDARRLQRFQNEAQAAAQLHHTNIVPVYAVGSDRGVHYYAMQFIDGQTLAAVINDLRGTKAAKAKSAEPVSALAGKLAADAIARAEGADACGERMQTETTPPVQSEEPTVETAFHPAATKATDLSSRNRSFFQTVAKLGIEAAMALDHAHELGVVHRDIKPANLLVDVRGKLWVTDFGLAQFQTESGLTLTGDLVGTLRYMSPEQAQAQRVPVDHRTDIYSLGVTLYELLTLQPAFPGADRQELLRHIAVDEPKSPRRIDPAIPTELEIILQKAMEKNPADRYATAQELADDLRHFLEHRPIRARRPSTWHRLRKWGRRHQAVVASALAALVLVMVVGLVAVERDRRRTNEAYLSLSAEQEKTRVAYQEAKREGERAEREKAAAQAVRDFLRNKLLAQASPRVQAKAVRNVAGKSAPPKPDPTVRELLDRAALELTPDKIEVQFPGQPLVQAEILKTIGEAYGAIGEFVSAIDHLKRALETDVRELGADHAETLSTMESLAKTYLDDRKLKEAASLFEQVYQGRTQTLGKDHLDTLASLNNLSRVYFKMGPKREEALRLREDLVKLRRAKQGPTHPGTLDSMNQLANSYAAAGRMPQALKLHEEILGLRKAKLGADDPDALQSMNNVANCLAEVGQLKEALQLHQETLEGRRARLGVDDPDTLQSMNNVGVAYSSLDRQAEALKVHQETLALRIAKLHLEHPDTHKSMNAVAWLLANLPDEGQRDPGKALELAKQNVDFDPEEGDYWNTLAAAHYRVGDWKSAVDALNSSMRLRQGGDASDRFFLAMAHWRLGDKNQARTDYRQGVEWMVKHKSQEEELRRFRAEAAKLLEIEK